MRELLAQELRPDRIVFASSSGGTQAGLLAGAQIFGYDGRITGIYIGKSGKSDKEELLDLSRKAAELIGERVELSEDQLDLRTEYSEPGYAVLTDLERDAIRRFARAEGVLLDPVYTGRAAGGMLDLIARGEIAPDERVLFWHTGGTPALFAYGEQLVSHA